MLLGSAQRLTNRQAFVIRSVSSFQVASGRMEPMEWNQLARFKRVLYQNHEDKAYHKSVYWNHSWLWCDPFDKIRFDVCLVARKAFPSFTQRPPCLMASIVDVVSCKKRTSFKRAWNVRFARWGHAHVRAIFGSSNLRKNMWTNFIRIYARASDSPKQRFHCIFNAKSH